MLSWIRHVSLAPLLTFSPHPHRPGQKAVVGSRQGKSGQPRETPSFALSLLQKVGNGPIAILDDGECTLYKCTSQGLTGCWNHGYPRATNDRGIAHRWGKSHRLFHKCSQGTAPIRIAYRFRTDCLDSLKEWDTVLGCLTIRTD